MMKERTPLFVDLSEDQTIQRKGLLPAVGPPALRRLPINRVVVAVEELEEEEEQPSDESVNHSTNAPPSINPSPV